MKFLLEEGLDGGALRNDLLGHMALPKDFIATQLDEEILFAAGVWIVESNIVKSIIQILQFVFYSKPCFCAKRHCSCICYACSATKPELTRTHLSCVAWTL